MEARKRMVNLFQEEYPPKLDQKQIGFLDSFVSIIVSNKFTTIMFHEECPPKLNQMNSENPLFLINFGWILFVKQDCHRLIGIKIRRILITFGQIYGLP